jgi:hypothetical protein
VILFACEMIDFLEVRTWLTRWAEILVREVMSPLTLQEHLAPGVCQHVLSWHTTSTG